MTEARNATARRAEFSRRWRRIKSIVRAPIKDATAKPNEAKISIAWMKSICAFFSPESAKFAVSRVTQDSNAAIAIARNSFASVLMALLRIVSRNSIGSFGGTMSLKPLALFLVLMGVASVCVACYPVVLLSLLRQNAEPFHYFYVDPAAKAAYIAVGIAGILMTAAGLWLLNSRRAGD